MQVLFRVTEVLSACAERREASKLTPRKGGATDQALQRLAGVRSVVDMLTWIPAVSCMLLRKGVRPSSRARTPCTALSLFPLTRSFFAALTRHTCDSAAVQAHPITSSRAPASRLLAYISTDSSFARSRWATRSPSSPRRRPPSPCVSAARKCSLSRYGCARRNMWSA